LFSLQHIIGDQLYSSISFGTRFSSYLAALKNFISHPLGVGWGPYLHYYSESLNSIVSSDIMERFSLGEVKGYIGTSKNLSTKTFFFNHLIFGGIPFLFFFYLFFVRRYFFISKIKNVVFTFVRIPLLYIILSGFIYITFDIKYEVWFFLAFVDVIANKLKKDE
jgi:hypothetical protein